MRKIIIGLLFIFTYSLSGSAQEFNTAAGARFGIPLSFTYKKYISDLHALEGIAGYRSTFNKNYLTLGAAYQIHNPIPNDAFKHLYWYYGAGAAIFVGDINFSAVQGYIGLSLSIDDIPLNLSVDWVPTIALGEGGGFAADYGALSARYILNR